jgi:hypothetical protein
MIHQGPERRPSVWIERHYLPAILLTGVLLVVTLAAALPYVSYQPGRWQAFDEFVSGNAVRSYEPWTPDAAWVAINITTDFRSQVIVNEEGKDQRVFDNITHLELECFAPTILDIRLFQGGRVLVEVITYYRTMKDNTGVLNNSIWYNILFVLTCIGDIYAYQKHVRLLPSTEHKEKGRVPFSTIAWKLAVVLFFPISMTASGSYYGYGASLIYFQTEENGLIHADTSFPSVIVLISLLCLPGILFTYRLPLIQGMRQVILHTSAAILVTTAVAYAPLFIRYSYVRHALLPLILVLFVLVPLFKYRTLQYPVMMRTEGISKWREAMPTAVLLLGLFVPHSLLLRRIPYYSNLLSLWGLMWGVSLTESFWTDDYGVTQSDAAFSLQLAYDWQILTWVVYGLRFLYAYGIVRYAQGYETKQRAITVGLLNILFSWMVVETITIATGPISPYPGALNLVIPLPIFFLIGLGVIQVTTPLQQAEDMVESAVLKGKTDRMIGNVKSDEISISGTYVMLSRIRKFIANLFKRDEKSKHD